MRTRADCELEVSVYPAFAYNATGGGGTADAEDLGNGLLRITFDPKARKGDCSWPGIRHAGVISDK